MVFPNAAMVSAKKIIKSAWKRRGYTVKACMDFIEQKSGKNIFVFIYVISVILSDRNLAVFSIK